MFNSAQVKPVDPAFIPVTAPSRQAADISPAVRVTDGLANDQLLYFTSPSLLADDRRLVFISDRTGQPNLFLRNLVTGEQWQLSRNTEGFLKSYVYFDGTPYRGFGKASVSVDAVRGKVYFIQGQQICCANTAGVVCAMVDSGADSACIVRINRATNNFLFMRNLA